MWYSNTAIQVIQWCRYNVHKSSGRIDCVQWYMWSTFSDVNYQHTVRRRQERILAECRRTRNWMAVRSFLIPSICISRSGAAILNVGTSRTCWMKERKKDVLRNKPPFPSSRSGPNFGGPISTCRAWKWAVSRTRAAYPWPLSETFLPWVHLIAIELLNRKILLIAQPWNSKESRPNLL